MADGDAMIERFQLLNDEIFTEPSKTHKVNLHHLQPVWASGPDTAKNMWIASASHQTVRSAEVMAVSTTLLALQNGSVGDYDNIHDWWAYNLFWEFNQKLTKKEKCYLSLPPTPMMTIINQASYIGTYTENNVTRIATKFKDVKDAPKKDVYIIMTCPEYCSDWKL